MSQIDVAGLKIDPITKKEFLEALLKRVQIGEKTFVITPYSEFLYYSFQDQKLLDVFNMADFSLADGIGIFWAKKYLDLALTTKNYWLRILQALWQLKYSLAAIVFNPRWIKSALPEKIVGADLIWDMAKIAAENSLSIFLLGGFEDTPELVVKALKEKFPSLNIAGISIKNPDDASIIDDINNSKTDLLFVAYGPIKQEKWIAKNLAKLNVKLAIGLGGSFDYIAGKKSSPPKFVRYSGLEWLYRLITQPYRFGRIINATFGLMWSLWHYKVFNSLPIRQNVVAVIFNTQNQVLVCRRNPDEPYSKNFGYQREKVLDYWQFPQGGLEDQEDIWLTLERECREELDITGNLSLLGTSAQKHTYFWNNALRPFLGHSYRNRGQTQTIAYLKYAGDPKSIRVDNIEFIDYKWVETQELISTLHEQRRELGEIVLRDLNSGLIKQLENARI